MGLPSDVGSLIGGFVGRGDVARGYGQAASAWNNAPITANNPWADYAEDPAAKQYQMAALQHLQQVSRPGGDVQAKSDIQEQLGRSAAATRGQTLAALNTQAAQGTVGGGQMLAANQGAGQNQVAGQAAGTATAAGQGYLRSLQAMATGGQQAGAARGQEQQFQGQKRGGTQAINEFNAQQAAQRANALANIYSGRGITLGKIDQGLGTAAGGVAGGAYSAMAGGYGG